MDSATRTQADNACMTEGASDQVDDLLQPVQFDWADDVEEEMQDNPSPLEGSSNIASEYPAELPQPEESSSLVYEFAQPGMEVSQVFGWRDYCTHVDRDIHHFSWLGYPVYEHSATPPEVSLLFMLSNPKTPQLGDEYRLQSILCRATIYVDPVLVYLDKGLEALQLRGCDIIRFATGKTFKFYTPHGQWANDSREWEAQTTIDDGDAYTYISPTLVTGNGFAEICPIRSTSEWEEARNERFAASRAFSGNLYRSKMRNRVYTPSPLGQSMVPDDMAPGMTAGNKADNYHASDSDNSEEAQDSVGALPDFVAMRKTSSNGSGCSLFKGSLRRRSSSFDLKSQTGTSWEPTHRKDDLFPADDSEYCRPSAGIEAHSSVRPASWESPTKTAGKLDVDTEQASEIGLTASGVLEPDHVETTLNLACCEAWNGIPQTDVKDPPGFSALFKRRFVDVFML
ncbi:hypothetical protein PHISP_03993 [Aspergillus sp. HF37]|nr:hypothetical protein PHISP_03993 [Aspergillus sp. HF37]